MSGVCTFSKRLKAWLRQIMGTTKLRVRKTHQDPQMLLWYRKLQNYKGRELNLQLHGQKTSTFLRLIPGKANTRWLHMIHYIQK